MAEVEDEEEVSALREALRQQTLAVEKLRAELEEERQAASSGADEALAMILRLQAEKGAARMEAEQSRRVAEERIQHDEDSLAFLKAVVFHQDMEISSLNHRLLAVCASNDPYASAAAEDGAVYLPWLRPMAKNGVPSRRNASLPAARLEELCSEHDAGGGGEDGYSCKNVGDRRLARTVSDLGEVIRREEWVRSNVSHQAPPRLHLSASHRFRRVPTYSAQCGVCPDSVHDKFEAPESVAAHVPPRPSRRASPEIISKEEDLISSTPCIGDRPRNERKSSDHRNISELGADIEQIKDSVQNLQTELSRMRETSMSRCDAQARLLTEICAKLDAIQKL